MSSSVTVSKRRTWTVAIQRSIASHWKLALGCAAAAWLVARFIQGRSSSTTDPAEARRLASERADYFERKGQAAKAARPARKPGSDGSGEACPPAPAQPVRAEDLVSPPRYLPPAESAAEASVSRRDVVHVRDGGYEWQAANALFDTGNESLTVLDAAFARRHGLYAEGGGSGIFAQAEPSPSPALALLVALGPGLALALAPALLLALRPGLALVLALTPTRPSAG